VNLAGGTVTACETDMIAQPFCLKTLKTSVRAAFESYRLSEAADLTVRACAATNKWIADLAPWKMKGDETQQLRTASCRVLIEAVYVLAHFFAPFIPRAAEAIFQKLGNPPKSISQLADNFMNLAVGTPVVSTSILFEQLEVAKAAVAAPAKVAAPVQQPLFSKLDVRVGRVVKAWHHPSAERLFVENIDIGEPTGPRQIVSGLREHYKLDEFEGRKILVVANMKPMKLVGVESAGMVLCAKNPTAKVVELIDVPDELAVGDRLLPRDVPFTFSTLKPEEVKKQKVWETIAKELRTDGERVACFAGVPLTTEGGARFLAPTQPNVEIS